MADITKYAPINGGSLFSDFKTHFSIFRTKKSVSLAYGFVFIFLAFTIFIAFSPSSNSSSPWFSNIFSLSTSSRSSSTTSSSIFSDESYRSPFSSIYYCFFPNNSSPLTGSQNTLPLSPNLNNGDLTHDKVEVLKPKNGTVLPSVNSTVNNYTIPQKPTSDLSNGSINFNQNQTHSDKVEVLKPKNGKNLPFVNSTVNNDTIPEKPTSDLSKGSLNFNQNQTQSDKVGVLKANQSTIVEKGEVKNLTSSLMKKQNNGSDVAKGKQGNDDLVKSLMNCDLFDGNWVRDEFYPLYKPGSCSLIDEQFNCFLNGRPDNGYHKFKWKPKGCTLPRLDGSHMLEMLRGKRLVFVGDSLNRNMWESLICILRNSVKDKKKVYEEFGRHHFRTEPSYSFVFADYKFTVEFFVSPFLVQEWEALDKNGNKKETLRLDLVGRSADKYKHADIIVFNTGHWWTHEKTSKGNDYYQEGSHVYSELNVMEAFRKALTTWGRWVDANVNPTKSLVFFRGYSASHFR
ncbi:hypothetical protein RD792_000321 [Penstemon davidsonii]|uniref:Trichome birefringence-like N-terminal domain-containing protein n=1 Tax=Penstemon davidsonii TaxID=160366 RepID=A0ABR0DLK0_9LAMI|nr:hypothetical protein RD792_000321 [Penstemon davidsonii]